MGDPSGDGRFPILFLFLFMCIVGICSGSSLRAFGLANSSALYTYIA